MIKFLDSMSISQLSDSESKLGYWYICNSYIKIDVSFFFTLGTLYGITPWACWQVSSLFSMAVCLDCPQGMKTVNLSTMIFSVLPHGCVSKLSWSRLEESELFVSLLCSLYFLHPNGHRELRAHQKDVRTESPSTTVFPVLHSSSSMPGLSPRWEDHEQSLRFFVVSAPRFSSDISLYALSLRCEDSEPIYKSLLFSPWFNRVDQLDYIHDILANQRK